MFIKYLTPPAAPAPKPAAAGNMVMEMLAGKELFRLLAAGKALRSLPAGNGEPVILIPGYKAPEGSMTPLQRFLRRRGYAARHWGFGTNQGRPEADSEAFARQLLEEVEETGEPLRLVGWSLGGVIARETARLVPDAVKQVITLGTPVIGGPTYTPAARVYGPEECARIAARVKALDENEPISVPITALFTRRDSVVPWEAAIDRYSEQVTHFEVQSTHLSLGIDPDVWTIVATVLHEGE